MKPRSVTSSILTMKNRPASIRLLVGFCALLSLLLTWKATIAGEVYAPARLLLSFHPWNQISTSQEDHLPWDVLWWDGAAQFYPWREVTNRLWRSGEIPLWNPYALSGTPLLANSQSAPFYPVHLLTFWISTPRLMGWLAWFHLFWAGLGMALWLRRMGLGAPACLLGAGVWSLSAFFTSWLALTSVPATLSWFGWAMLGASLCASNPKRLYALALPLGCMILAGHLQFALYGWMLAGAYWFLQAVRKDQENPSVPFSRLTSGLSAFFFAFLLSAIQLLPALELSSLSHRANVASEAGYEAYLRNALPPLHLLTLFFPDAFGNPRAGNYWGAGHYAEFALYVGLAALFWAMMVGGRMRKIDLYFWLGIWGIGMLLALGTPLNRLLYFYLPGFSGAGSPARVLCLCAFALAVLCAFGFDRFWNALKPEESTGNQEPSPNRLLTKAMIGWSAACLLCVLIGYALLPAQIPAQQLTSSLLSQWKGLLLLGLLLGVCFLSLRQAVSPALTLSLMIVLSLLIPFTQAFLYNPTTPAELAYPSTPEIQKAPRQSDDGFPARIAALNTRWSLYETPNATLPPNTSAVYGLYDVAGYDSLAPRHYKRFLDWINGGDSAPLENGNMFFVKAADPRLQWLRSSAILTAEGWQPIPDIAGEPNYLGAAELVENDEQMYERLQEAWQSGKVLLLKSEAEQAMNEYGSVSDAPVGATIRAERYRARSLTLRVSNPASETAWLLLSETWYPGWKAEIGDKSVPMLRANGAFRALPVPPGDHTIRMHFMPESFQRGSWATLFALVFLLFFMRAFSDKRSTL